MLVTLECTCVCMCQLAKDSKEPSLALPLYASLRLAQQSDDVAFAASADSIIQQAKAHT